MSRKSKILLFIVLAFLLLLILIFTGFFVDLFKIIQSIFNIIFISFICAYFCKPIFKKICDKTKIRKSIIALILVFLIFFMIGISLFFIINSMVKEWNKIGIILDELENANNVMKQKVNSSDNKVINTMYNELFENINYAIESGFTKNTEYIIDKCECILDLSVMPLLIYYFLTDGGKVLNLILQIFSPRKRIIIKRILKNIDIILGKYILSQIVLCLIIFILTYISLLVLGVPLPFFMASINGIFNLIPYFGPVIGAIPAIIVAFLKSKTTALWVAIIIFAIQQLEGNFLSPLITAYSVSIHPVTVILLVLIGGKLFGAVGMLIAVPIGIIVKQIYKDITEYLF